MTGNSIARRLLSALRGSSPINGVTGVILAAGLGRRMGTLTQSTPKPLLPVLNCPILAWSMSQMFGFGIRHIIVNTYHLGEAFEPLQAIAAEAGVILELRPELRLTGPFGGVLACTTSLPRDGDILVFAGDGLYDADLSVVLETHRGCGADLTVAITSVPDGSRYGVLDVDRDGFVRGMQEKPADVGAVSTACCGVYVVSGPTLDRFAKAKRPLDWVDVVDALLSDGRPVGTTRIAGWMDAGTPTDLLTLNSQMLVPQTLERISDRLPGSAASASVWTQGNPPILSGVELRGTVLIGAHVSIGGGSIIENTVIGPGARIGVNARVSGSLVLPGGKIRSNAIVMTDVVDRA